jgi:hypothetical protein
LLARTLSSRANFNEENTKDCAIEYEFVSATFIGFENFDMYDTKDEIENKENCRDGNIGYDLWAAAEALVTRSIWRTLCDSSPCLIVCLVAILG